MSPAAHSPTGVERMAPVRQIVRRWRALTGGRRTRDRERRTLIACSGGADSSALVLALASASRDLVVGHVVHDMRSEVEARADADAVRELARRVGLPCDEERVLARNLGGNLEAQSRRLRYRALAEMARRHGCRHVATAHHADDQLETLLMRLARGTALRGLGGIAAVREIGVEGISLVRPMLGVSRRDAERICAAAGWAWRIDATNLDARRLRAAVRERVVPALKELSPGVERRAARTADLLRDAAGLVEERVDELMTRAIVPESGRGWSWARNSLRRERIVVLGALFRRTYTLLHGEGGLDQRSGRLMEQTARAVRSSRTDPGSFDWGPVVVRVSAATVTVAVKDGT
jgi:tRNA(Ile)-lysidine synthase